MDYDFRASTGDTVVLDREVPQESDGLCPTGFAVVARERYFFKAYMHDSDPDYSEDAEYVPELDGSCGTDVRRDPGCPRSTVAPIV